MRKILSMVAGVLLVCSPTHAQTSDRDVPRRIPAWVAIAPEGQAEPYRVLRFGGNAPHDVILLGSSADGNTLTRAIEALLAARRVSSDLASSDATFRVHSATRRTRTPLPWADRVLRDVRVAAPREVPRVGRVQAVRIWLPPQGPG
jgi:hypothetical protein